MSNVLRSILADPRAASDKDLRWAIGFAKAANGMAGVDGGIRVSLDLSASGGISIAGQMVEFLSVLAGVEPGTRVTFDKAARSAIDANLKRLKDELARRRGGA